ncbi:MAG: hypothetical protein K8S54_00610 [Spirochaetia bacterium]|nr:hypothetical protein [Spirochaetia bacterium]
MIQRLVYPAAFLFAFIAIVSRLWVTEDAFITFRMVENIFAGHGYLFNPGEPVEASTHPIWSAALILLRGVGLPLDVGSVLLGLLFSFIGIGILIRRSAGAGAFPFAVLALCSISGFRDFATSGLEFSLTFLLIVLFYQELERGSLSSSPIYKALLLVTLYLNRPETGLFYAYYSIVLLWELFQARHLTMVKRLGIAAGWGVPLLIPIAYHLFRWAYFDALFQNPYYAKAGLASNGVQGFKYILHSFIFAPAIPIAAVMLVAIFFLHRMRSAFKPVELNGLIRDCGLLVILTLYVIRVGGDFMAFRLWLPEAVMLCLLVDRFFLRRPDWLVFGSVTPTFGKGLAFALFVILSFLPVPIANGYIADERAVYASMGAGQLTGWEKNPWAVRGVAFKKLQSCIGYEKFWIANSQADAKCLRGVGLGYLGVAAGAHVKIQDEQGLSDRTIARNRVLLRFRPGHEHYTTFQNVLDKGVLFCSTGEPEYDRAMATSAGIVIHFEPDLLSTIPGIRNRLNRLIELKRTGSSVIPRLETRYGRTVEQLYADSETWEADPLQKSKNQCWDDFEGGVETYFY